MDGLVSVELDVHTTERMAVRKLLQIQNGVSFVFVVVVMSQHTVLFQGSFYTYHGYLQSVMEGRDRRVIAGGSKLSVMPSLTFSFRVVRHDRQRVGVDSQPLLRATHQQGPAGPDAHAKGWLLCRLHGWGSQPRRQKRAEVRNEWGLASCVSGLGWVWGLVVGRWGWSFWSACGGRGSDGSGCKSAVLLELAGNGGCRH